MLASLNLPIQLIAGTLSWLLLGFTFTVPEQNCLMALLAPKADAIQPIDTVSQSVYFHRRGALRRCFVTYPGNCIFENSSFPTTPDVARELFRDYRKSAFMAEIAVSLSSLGEFDQARILIQLISVPSVQVSALVGISEQQLKNGQTKQSQQTLVEAVKFFQSGNFRPRHKVHALTKIATQYSAIGQHETAANLFKSALALQEKPSIPFPAEEELIVAVGLLKAGQINQAEKITQQFLQAVQKSPLEPFTSPSVLEPLLTAGEHDFATRLVQQLRDSKYRTRWLSEVCSSLVQSGEFDRATQLASNLPSDNSCSKELRHEQDAVSTAIDVVEQVKAGKTSTAISSFEFFVLPQHKQVLLLTEIAIELDEVGQAEQSQQILLQAIEQSSSLGISNFGAGLGKMQIAIRLAESRRFAKALAIAEVVEEDSYKILAMLNIANQYIQYGEKEKALNVLSKTIEITATLKCKSCE